MDVVSTSKLNSSNQRGKQKGEKEILNPFCLDCTCSTNSSMGPHGDPSSRKTASQDLQDGNPS